MAAKHKWIRTAVSGAHGQFRAKAEKAGKSTRQYAAEEAGAPGLLGKQARLAENLMGMRHKSGAKEKRRYAEKSVSKG